jgi:hypothetical protein
MTDERLIEISKEIGLACLNGCGRSNAHGGRGCCPACYVVFRKRVKRGDVTWAALEAAGKVRAPRSNKHWGNMG